MKNLKLVMFFTVCFLFAGMQYATAQIKDKIEEVKTTTEEVKEEIKQETSKLNPEDDKRVYTTKATKATEAKKVETEAKLEETIEQPKGVNGEATIKELDSDDLEDHDLDDDDLDDDDN